jgi:hypothetical protein
MMLLPTLVLHMDTATSSQNCTFIRRNGNAVIATPRGRRIRIGNSLGPSCFQNETIDERSVPNQWFGGKSKLAPQSMDYLAIAKVFVASAFSIAVVTGLESGSTSESNRAATLPSRPTRNLVKFQPISQPVFG